MIDHIYVVNMDKDKDRLDNFQKQVNNQFEYERVVGVDMNMPPYKNMYKEVNVNKSLKTFEWSTYLKKSPELITNGIDTKEKATQHWIKHGQHTNRHFNRKQTITNGEHGCLQSHINIFTDAIDKEYETILVFEDDAIFRDSWENIQKEIQRLNTDNIMLLYLGASQHNWKKIIYKPGCYNANRTTGTFAYMVKKPYFTYLLEKFNNRQKPVDNYLIEAQGEQPGRSIVMFPNKVICNVEHSNIHKSRNQKYTNKKFKW